MTAVFARFQWPYSRIRPADEEQVEQAIAASDDTVAITLQDSIRSESTSAPLLEKNGISAEADKNVEDLPSSWGSNRLKALGCIVIASLTFSIASVCVKFESNFMGSQETVFWRSAIGLALNYVCSYLTNVYANCKLTTKMFIPAVISSSKESELGDQSAPPLATAVSDSCWHIWHEHPVLRHVEHGSDRRHGDHVHEPDRDLSTSTNLLILNYCSTYV